MYHIKKYIRQPQVVLTIFLQNYFAWLPDKLYIELLFWLNMGYRLNLRNPKTFSEKLQWLKLYNRRPEYTKLVDKYSVKEHVANIIGEQYVIPTLGIWEKPEEIDWDNLPDQFVLKTTHGGGNAGVVICKNKQTFDRQSAIVKLNKSLKQDIYRALKEWPYKDVPHRIIAEKYINPAPIVGDLPDYKWYCFHGEPKFCQVIKDRTTNETIDFFDTEWNHLEFVGLNPNAGNARVQSEKPLNLEKHIRIARELSKGIPFSRIDLFETGKNTFFGEITLYPGSGLGKFRPDQFNYLLGEMVKLPGEKRGEEF